MAFRKQCDENAKIATVGPIRSKEDIQEIVLWFMEQDMEKYAVLFKFGCYTGLRAGDIVNFKVKDVYKKNHVVLREQKTAKVKEFKLNPIVQDLLNNWVEKNNLETEDYLFQGRRGVPIDRSQVYRLIVKACEDIGIETNVGTHTMRKTFGYHHYKQFNDIATLQKIYNHSSPDVTLTYIGITQDRIDETYTQLDLEVHDKKKEKLEGNNRTRIQRVVKYCKTYIDLFGKFGVNFQFAQNILDLIYCTKPYTDKSQGAKYWRTKELRV